MPDKPAISISKQPVLMSTTSKKVLTAKPAHTAHSDCLRCSKLILVKGELDDHGEDSAKQAECKPTRLCHKGKRIGQLRFRRRIRSCCLLLQSLLVSVRIRYVYFALIMLSLLHHEHIPSTVLRKRDDADSGIPAPEQRTRFRTRSERVLY